MPPGNDAMPADRASDPALRVRAIVIGVLFILATALGVTSAIFASAIVGAEDMPAAVLANASGTRLTVLMEILMAASIIGIAFCFYPVLQRGHPALAVGYVGLRAIEAGLIAAASAVFLGMLSAADEGLGELVPFLNHLAEMLFNDGAALFFGLSALALNYILWRRRLVPVWISVWGLIGGVLILCSGSLILFGVPLGTMEAVLNAPIALNEMVLALWLIFRGLDNAAA